ncbi:MAG TPA: SLC13 family permease [Burkholderiales bacterium]|nr:SLC13 family permease [Burkholderiales bacterium]
MNNTRTILTATVLVAAAVLFFLPPPDGLSVQTMRSGALVLFTVGFWAVGSLPEHVTGLLFFLVAMVFAVAPAQVVFSGFASATLWLVLGGLIIAQAVTRTGLAQRLSGVLFARFATSYVRLVIAVVVAAVALSFVMPATVGRVLLMTPIVVAAAEGAGFAYGSKGYDGLCLAAMMTTYQCGTAVLPANAPNLVLAGAAEALYGVELRYAEYLWYQFPVMGFAKACAIIGLVCWLFPATARRAAPAPVVTPLTAEQRRMAVILIASLLLWATDFAHGITAGWIALGAGIACVMPRIGVMSYAAFNEVRFGPYFYVAAALGLGVLTQKSGLSEALGTSLHGVLVLRPGADFVNYTVLSLFSTVAGVFTTNPAQPAVLAPLAQQFTDATAWPLKTALMTMAVGFSTMILPHQVPPVVVGMQAAGLRLAPMIKLSVPLAILSIVVLFPLHYLWWRLIGAFG